MRMLSKSSQLRTNERGSSTVLVLVLLAVLAVGGLTYYSMKVNKTDAEDASADLVKAEQMVAATEEVADGDAAVKQKTMEIKPGNPVVATVNGEKIERMEVLNFIQTLPENTRQMPIGQLFPAALDQIITAKVIEENTSNVRLDNDPEVQKQLEEARKNIVRNIYVQKQVDERLTDERLQKAYADYKANFPDVEEVKAAHILVDDEKLAKSLIQKIEGGEDFATLAKENSKDNTAENGGDIGYFAEGEVVEEFAKAAFETPVGEITHKPVKTQFGYHVIKVEDKRQRPAAEYDQVKPFLEAEMRRVILSELVSQWRNDVEIERYDINGDPIKTSDVQPAAGEVEAQPSEEG